MMKEMHVTGPERMKSQALKVVLLLHSKKKETRIISKCRSCRIKNKNYVLAVFEKNRLMEAKGYFKAVLEN